MQCLRRRGRFRSERQTDLAPQENALRLDCAQAISCAGSRPEASQFAEAAAPDVSAAASAAGQAAEDVQAGETMPSHVHIVAQGVQHWGEGGEEEGDEAEEDGAEAVRRQWAVPEEEGGAEVVRRQWAVPEERAWDLVWYSHWP